MKAVVAVLGVLALAKTVFGEEPRNVAQGDLAAIVAAVTRGEPVRITSGASGFNLYGQGKSGHIGASADGLVVHYGRESYHAAKVAGGWAISGKDFHARIASRSGGEERSQGTSTAAFRS